MSLLLSVSYRNGLLSDRLYYDQSRNIICPTPKGFILSVSPPKSWYYLNDTRYLTTCISFTIHRSLLFIFCAIRESYYFLYVIWNFNIFRALFGTLIFSVRYSELKYCLCVNRNFIIFCTLFWTMRYTALNVSCPMHKASLYFFRMQKFSYYFSEQFFKNVIFWCSNTVIKYYTTISSACKYRHRFQYMEHSSHHNYNMFYRNGPPGHMVWPILCTSNDSK